MASELPSPELPPIVCDDDNPEWTEEDFARARPAHEVLPAEVIAAFGKGRGGRSKVSATSDHQQLTLRIPGPVLDHFKAGGPGWQTRMVAVLEQEAAKDRAA